VVVEKLKKEIEDLFAKGIQIAASPPKTHSKVAGGKESQLIYILIFVDEKHRWKAESNKM
jgi:hypothetical protein